MGNCAPRLSIVLSFMLMLQCAGAAAQAQEKAEETMPEAVIASPVVAGLPLWEAGLIGGGVTQPAYPGADERANLLLGLPYMIYRGEYLRVDRGTVGVRALKTRRMEVDVGFAASLGSRAENIEARRGMDDLGTLLEFGPRLRINLGDVSEGSSDSRIQFPLRAVFDLNDHFRYRGIAFEPQWVKDTRLPAGWTSSLNLGAVFGDQQLMDTFYRVSPAEAIVTRPAYNAKSGLIALRASLFVSHLFNPDVRFFSYLRVDSVEGAANHDSPLVRRDIGWSVGLGLAWTLARSERIARD
jgi:outer membrane scaffolding protein for murein synthesis (MipA/OmpV family)